MGQQNIWRLASGAAAAWSILEGCCLFHAWEAMVVIWTMIDDMRSWFRRAEFDPLWVLRRFWFVEEEDRLRLSQMKCYSGSVCSCKVYGSCRGIYGRPPRNSWELSFWSRSRTACIVNVVTTPKRAGQLGQDVALCVWCIYGAYFVRLQEPVLLDVLCVIFIDFR